MILSILWPILMCYDPYPEYPPLSDLDLFPPRSCVRDAMQFNREYRKHLQMTRGFELRADELDKTEQALGEAARLYHLWDLLDDVSACSTVQRRRQALGRLRELLGDEAYYSGKMPPAVPLWRIPPRY